MQISLSYRGKSYVANLAAGIDISLDQGSVKCFYAPDVKASPYTSGDFVGSVKAGAPVNFYNLQINPHGNGTHTECLGHITPEQEQVGKHIKQHHCIARLLTITPEPLGDNDFVITKAHLETVDLDEEIDGLVIRTLPNPLAKKTRDYSGTNPPYLTTEAMQYIVNKDIIHLLLDLPSVDREEDEGKLAAHHIFWGINNNKRTDCSITELIYVPDAAKDGVYLLNLQIAPIALDAAPSRPILYPIIKK